VLIACAFLAGSVPFGLVVARAKGIDIRAHGSGNIGATNVGRALGRRWFLVVFSLDFAKGFVPTIAAGVLLGCLGRMAVEPLLSLQWLAVALASILGHVFSPWLGFRGGKGVATSAGSLLAVFPAITFPALAGFATFLVVMRLWRFMSVSSMAAACSLPLGVAAWFHLAHLGVTIRPEPPVQVHHMLPYLGVTTLIAALVVWTHRGNIARLRRGTEPRWVRKPGQTPATTVQP
jgi:acyl phosphate:glycerol-3-phosphate acyltransferase